jgi:hypothetical protein
MIGAIVGAGVMFSMWKFTPINGYLYTASGIATCVVVGSVTSLAFGKPLNDLTGLTVYTLHAPELTASSAPRTDTHNGHPANCNEYSDE